MTTPDSSNPSDPRTYDGPDSDIAAGNISDADFTPSPAPEVESVDAEDVTEH